MKLANAPAPLTLPFANSAATINTVPVTATSTQIAQGFASFSAGFPPITLVAKSAGGQGPRGADFNGIFKQISSPVLWANLGAAWKYSSALAGDANIGGYPKGARVLQANGVGTWISQTDDNADDPDAAYTAKWAPSFAGSASVAVAASNVTLTPAQYGQQTIVLTGTLTASLIVIFPPIPATWTVINETTGSFNITVQTTSQTLTAPTLVAGANTVHSDGTNAYLASQVAFASSAEVITGTVTTKVISPATLQSAPLTRAWVTFDGATGAVKSSYNIASVSRSSAGVYVITFGSRQPSNATYLMTGTCGGTSNGAVAVTETVPVTRSTTAMTIRTLLSNMTTSGDCDFVSVRFDW